jgi:hypothetical protein
MKILILSSTKKECGIAEYTRQLFRDEFESPSVRFDVVDISCVNLLCAPFKKADILHIQHEFFMFDRFAGLSAIFYYLYLILSGCRIVTTIDSTYDIDRLKGAFPHCARYYFLFALLKLYIKIHFRLVTACSNKIIVLSKIGHEKLSKSLTEKQMNKVNYIHLGNYQSSVGCTASRRRDALAGGGTAP